MDRRRRYACFLLPANADSRLGWEKSNSSAIIRDAPCAASPNALVTATNPVLDTICRCFFVLQWWVAHSVAQSMLRHYRCHGQHHLSFAVYLKHALLYFWLRLLSAANFIDSKSTRMCSVQFARSVVGVAVPRFQSPRRLGVDAAHLSLEHRQ